MSRKLKPKRIKKSFAEELFDRIDNSAHKYESVEYSKALDDSCQFIEIKSKDQLISFVFDAKGEKIEKIEMYQEITQVVNTKRIWPK